MRSNNTIPPENESRMTAFLNKEPECSEISNLEVVEMEELITAWELTGTSFSFTAADPDQAWGNLQNKIAQSEQANKFRFIKWPIFRIAAMIVVVLGIGYGTFKAVQSPQNHNDFPVKMVFAETEAHPANLSIITLPDGSSVKLNAGTKIEYPEKFGTNSRQVKLSGEAFFNVIKDPSHPFIIETENASVEVLGTSFNVSAYPNTSLIEVNVETGKVKLTQYSKGKSLGASAILPAGERGWLKVDQGELGHSAISSPNYSSWITKKINFQRTPLAEAFTILENTYHVRIIMENPEIGKMSYTANFADLKLDYIVEVIARTHQLKVNRNGDEIVFTRIKH